MSNGVNELLKGKAVNGWGLFWLISIPVCLVMFAAMMRTDLSTPAGVSSMIQLSVRCAVPFIYLVVAASSVHILFPGAFSKWWLRNRKYFGLCFAVGMAWQGLFIFIISTSFRDYYFEDVYLLRDELEGTVGYIFLPAMVITSFHFCRKHLSTSQWKLIHKSGIYFLWAYPFSVYWWNLYYYGNPLPIDYLYYWAGFLAVAVRIAAWYKKRQQSAERNMPGYSTSTPLRLFGWTIIACGLLASASGLYWQEAVTECLTSPQWSANMVLWFPFWPFEPYLPLLIIGLGALVATRAPSQPDSA